jgi:hypothetical protein
MLKPICVPCQRFFKPHKNGVWFTEGMPAGQSMPTPGTSAPEQWKPYKVWQGDKYKCQGCGSEIIVGVAMRPATEHYKEDFARFRTETGADQFQVNDC